MNGGQAVILAVVTPFVGAALIGLTHRWPNLREAVTLATAAVLFALVISLYGDVRAGARPALTVVEIMPGLGIHLAAEPLGVLFATVSSLLWNSYLGLFDRIHAGQRRAQPDPLLRVFRYRPWLRRRCRLRRRYLHPVHLLRGAHALDLSPGHPHRHA